jgi:hypothetical protein
MNRNQAIMLAIVAVNIVLILLFPPFDIYSIASSKVPTFGGFDFIFKRNQYMVINNSVLYLELFVVLINAGIAWLLLRPPKSEVKGTRIKLQNATLLVVAVNLVVIVLFPPFESVFSLSKAAIPDFEGFYFIFMQHPNHVIVTSILYLEVFLILINGALFWLIFRDKKPVHLTPEQAYALMMEMRKKEIK